MIKEYISAFAGSGYSICVMQSRRCDLEIQASLRDCRYAPAVSATGKHTFGTFPFELWARATAPTANMFGV